MSIHDFFSLMDDRCVRRIILSANGASIRIYKEGSSAVRVGSLEGIPDGGLGVELDPIEPIPIHEMATVVKLFCDGVGVGLDDVTARVDD